MRHTNDGLKKRCDCGRRKWAKCPHPWHFSFHRDGRRHRISLDIVAKARGERVPTSKTEAEAWRDRLRGEIRLGEFDSAKAVTATETALTFGDVVTQYRKLYVNVPTRRPSAAAMFEIHLTMLERAEVPAAGGATVTLKTKAMDAITKADVEHIRTTRREELAAKASTKIRRAGRKQGEVGINRLLARLRHLFAWAIESGFVNETPFKRHGQTVIKLEHKAEAPRQRRLQDGEEAKLLEHADAHLKAVIIAALSTGCRLGELLTLQWHQIRRDTDGQAIEILLPASLTKTNEARVLPVGIRLRAVLDMRQLDPDGEPHQPGAFVFGNPVGEQITSVRGSWEKACAAAGIVDLHVHDLRREFACRLLESSASLHDVKDFLGHANVSTTSTYLKSTPDRLAKALARLDGETPAPAAATAVETGNGSQMARTKTAEDVNGTTQSSVTH